MKLKLYTAASVMTIATLCIFSSCKKDLNNAVAPSVVQQFINGDTSLTLFNTALQRANDAALLTSTDSLTILAPTNTAFLSAGITTSVINALPVATLDSLLRYHFITGSVSLSTGVYNSFTSLLGPAVYGYGNTDGSTNYFNGNAAIIQTNSGSNIGLYKLNYPLQIPASSLNTLLAADTSLSLFTEAVAHTGLVVAPASGWNTILAPDNNSFIAAGYPTIASIDSANVGVLSNILQYHILPGQYFSNYFIGQSAINSSEGNSINITFNGNTLQFTGTSNAAPASVTLANEIAGTNIIVHKINAVLLP